jgi:peptidoglycan lytic transglycosylase A
LRRERSAWAVVLASGALLLLAATSAERIRDGGDRATLADATHAARAALERRLGNGGRSSHTRDDRKALSGLRALEAVLADAGDDGDIEVKLAARFRPRPATPLLVTGYHEPALSGRRRRDERFRFPVYAQPRAPADGGQAELPTRAEIDAGALAGRGLELVWVDDPIELFFLHVQGSGRIVLEDGSHVRLGFAATNRRPYTSIGKVLLDRGEFGRPEDATAPAIKAWLRAHPAQATAILHANERFVFFRALDSRGTEGPPGALDAPLVPLRSVAVDPTVTPLGTIGVLAVELPGGRQLVQLVIAMDTGAAIRGAGRLDLYVGSDQAAAEIAGLLRAPGTVSWLDLRPAG